MTTAERVLELAADPQTPSMAAIALEAGICREYVRQILRRAGVERFRPPGPVRCVDCGGPVSRRGHRCQSCASLARRIELHCKVCGVAFLRRRRLQTILEKRGYKNSMCSHHCRSVWCGRQRWKKEATCQR